MTLNTILILWLGSMPLLQPNESQINNIVRDWQERRKQSRSLVYEVKGERFVAKGIWSGATELPMPPEDFTGEISLRYVLDLSRNRFRRDDQDHFFHDKTGWYEQCRADLYDGVGFKVFRPKDRNLKLPRRLFLPDLIMNISKEDFSFFGMLDYPVFLAHGIIPLNGIPHPKHLESTYSPKDFEYIGMRTAEGTECALLKSKDDVLWWVDPKKKSSIIRVSAPDAQIDIKHKQIEWGWIPSEWTITYFRLGQPDNITEWKKVRVSSVVLNGPEVDNDFDLQEKPGMAVWNYDAKKIFDVNKAGELIERTRTRAGSGWLLWVTLGLGGCFLLLAIWRYRVLGKLFGGQKQ